MLIVASIFLFWMLREVGWANLGRHLIRVGYYWPLVLVPFGVVNCLTTLAWGRLLITTGPRPSFWRLFVLRLAGESLNQLTPTASLGGEPFRALHLKADGVRWEDATTSLVIQKGILVLSMVLYVFVGLALASLIFPVSGSHLGLLGLGASVLGAAGLIFMILQRKSPCTSGVRILEKLRICPKVLKNREKELASLDATMAGFYRDHPGRGLLAFCLVFSSWFLHAVEAYLIFRLLGHPIPLYQALCLDSLAMLFAGLGFMIPASAGIQDGGNILLALGLNLGATLGAAFSIMRRIREAFWLALGLIAAAFAR
jgi:uncharacterized protein (TIRG00374 family)